PNPFNPKTTIKYDIINDSFVKLNIYNLKGEKVKTLVNKNQLKGKYSIEFDGSNLASGIYLYVMEVGNKQFTKKMIMLK
ncbi:MAG: T9SS type A sorting domain-containing protein, partial [Candidatus Marinimicrobia bacterium]|nr:T9SS type A sorting domain-containing protein [Candidatus Neomarinimicrobiota bacterium]